MSAWNFSWHVFRSLSHEYTRHAVRNVGNASKVSVHLFHSGSLLTDYQPWKYTLPAFVLWPKNSRNSTIFMESKQKALQIRKYVPRKDIY